jgi:hypothetical protein
MSKDILELLKLGAEATEEQVKAAIEVLQTQIAELTAKNTKDDAATIKLVAARIKKAADTYFEGNKTAQKIFVTDNGTIAFVFDQEGLANVAGNGVFETFTPKSK